MGKESIHRTAGQKYVPVRVAAVDLRRLPCTPADAFLMSLVDGCSTVGDLAAAIGVTVTEVTQRLQQFESLGAIVWTGEAPAQRIEGVTAEGSRDPKGDVSGFHRRAEPRSRDATRVAAIDESAQARPAPSPVAEMEALLERAMRPSPNGIEAPSAHTHENSPTALALDEQERFRIDAVFTSLKEKSYYELLELDASCDRRAIRQAYFRLSKQFHPDTKFRRELGSYKSKMETVFARLTEAYDVLGKAKRRAEYDEYLSASQTSRLTRSSVPAPPPDDSIAIECAATAKVHEGPDPATPPRPVSPEYAAAAAARLRRALGQPSRLAAPTSVVDEQPRHARDPRGLLDESKRIAQVRSERSDSLAALTRARTARAEGALARAQQIIDHALRLDPHHPELCRERNELHHRRCGQAADQERADAEKLEQSKRWLSAALCWKRVADGEPGNAEVRFRAARALLQVANPDLRMAHRLLQEATLAAPRHAPAHLLLTHVYLLLGMKRNAQRELDLAKRCGAPENELEALADAVDSMS